MIIVLLFVQGGILFWITTSFPYLPVIRALIRNLNVLGYSNRNELMACFRVKMFPDGGVGNSSGLFIKIKKGTTGFDIKMGCSSLPLV